MGSFVYGYNQGVFSGILTMTSFGGRMKALAPVSLQCFGTDLTCRHGQLGGQCD